MSDPPLSIRNYQEGDLETLFDIDQTCFPADIAFSQREFIFYLSHPKSIARVAEEPGRILGFVLAIIETRRSAHLITLDVVPEARRRRIGTALMDAFHLEMGSQGIGISILEVAVENMPARRLYEKLGYKSIERLGGYYCGREDAYRMIRALK